MLLLESSFRLQGSLGYLKLHQMMIQHWPVWQCADPNQAHVGYHCKRAHNSMQANLNFCNFETV